MATPIYNYSGLGQGSGIDSALGAGLDAIGVSLAEDMASKKNKENLSTFAGILAEKGLSGDARIYQSLADQERPDFLTAVLTGKPKQRDTTQMAFHALKILQDERDNVVKLKGQRDQLLSYENSQTNMESRQLHSELENVDSKIFRLKQAMIAPNVTAKQIELYGNELKALNAEKESLNNRAKSNRVRQSSITGGKFSYEPLPEGDAPFNPNGSSNDLLSGRDSTLDPTKITANATANVQGDFESLKAIELEKHKGNAVATAALEKTHTIPEIKEALKGIRVLMLKGEEQFDDLKVAAAEAEKRNAVVSRLGQRAQLAMLPNGNYQIKITNIPKASSVGTFSTIYFNPVDKNKFKIDGTNVLILRPGSKEWAVTDGLSPTELLKRVKDWDDHNPNNKFQLLEDKALFKNPKALNDVTGDVIPSEDIVEPSGVKSGGTSGETVVPSQEEQSLLNEFFGSKNESSGGDLNALKTYLKTKPFK